MIMKWIVVWNNYKYFKNIRVLCSGFFFEIKCEYCLFKILILFNKKNLKKKVKIVIRSGINIVCFCFVDLKVK